MELPMDPSFVVEKKPARADLDTGYDESAVPAITFTTEVSGTR
jgi:hypothetical protein